MPAGLSWFERGQFSLYVALAYLLLIVGLMKKKPVLIAVSALFAYVKWTSFPFLLVIMAVHWLSAKNMKERVQYTQWALIYLLVLLALSLAFRSRFVHFFEGILSAGDQCGCGGNWAGAVAADHTGGLPIFLIFAGYSS